MDEHINNGNTTENTDPVAVVALLHELKTQTNSHITTMTTLMKNTKECALKWKSAVPKGVQENTGVL